MRGGRMLVQHNLFDTNIKTWIRSSKPKPHIDVCGPLLAPDYYKLCQPDYENDGCSKYLASSLEMSGLCCALLSQPVATPSCMKHTEYRTAAVSRARRCTVGRRVCQ